MVYTGINPMPCLKPLKAAKNPTLVRMHLSLLISGFFYFRKHQYVGNAKFVLKAEFRQSWRIIVVTEENVLASIDFESGQIGKYFCERISYSNKIAKECF